MIALSMNPKAKNGTPAATARDANAFLLGGLTLHSTDFAESAAARTIFCCTSKAWLEAFNQAAVITILRQTLLLPAVQAPKVTLHSETEAPRSVSGAAVYSTISRFASLSTLDHWQMQWLLCH